MKDTNYAYCVARLRANENKMLNKTQILKLVDSGSYDAAVRELVSFGWIEEKGALREIINSQTDALWKLLNECVPDKNELDCLCIINDYFNIKTAIKCHLCNKDPFEFYIRPSAIDLKLLTESINGHRFTSLGRKIAGIASKAYNLACITDNGQSVEVIIDRSAVDVLCEIAKQKRSGLINDVCGFLCDTSNIKVALRINYLNKNYDFANEAIGNCYRLDRKSLISLSVSDKDALVEYLNKSDYKEGIELYNESPVRFEKWCDDSIIKIISSAKFKAFGFDPVCAFYFAKLNEIKCVRIILASLMSGVDREAIIERIRLTYV